jgi:hypothetical protein
MFEYLLSFYLKGVFTMDLLYELYRGLWLGNHKDSLLDDDVKCKSIREFYDNRRFFRPKKLKVEKISAMKVTGGSVENEYPVSMSFRVSDDLYSLLASRSDLLEDIGCDDINDVLSNPDSNLLVQMSVNKSNEASTAFVYNNEEYELRLTSQENDIIYTILNKHCKQKTGKTIPSMVSAVQ